jgi:hypothetical protein
MRIISQISFLVAMLFVSMTSMAQSCSSECNRLNIDSSLRPSGWSYTQCIAGCNASNSDTLGKVQGCSVKEIRSLGYSAGNKHQFCLRKGWLGGEVAGLCWKVTEGGTSKETAEASCPRLWRYYNVAGKDHSCDHLAREDVRALKLAGGKLSCSGD